MIKYSFTGRNTNCTDKEVIQFLKTTTKPIKYTYGFKFKHPTTYEEPVSADEAIRNFHLHFTDVYEYEDYVDVNSYSDNDMW